MTSNGPNRPPNPDPVGFIEAAVGNLKRQVEAEVIDSRRAFALVGRHIGDLQMMCHELRVVCNDLFTWAKMFAEDYAASHTGAPVVNFPAPLPPGFEMESREAHEQKSRETAAAIAEQSRLEKENARLRKLLADAEQKRDEFTEAQHAEIVRLERELQAAKGAKKPAAKKKTKPKAPAAK